jgi:hypothetical protein
MNCKPQDLIHGYLDATLSADEENELNAWVKAAPENSATFAAMIRFHDHLRNVVRTGAMFPESPTASPLNVVTPSSRPARRRWTRFGVIGGGVTIAAGLLIAVWLSNTATVSAATELEHLIEKTATTGDRTYRIRNLDPNPAPMEPKQPPLDGAVLSIRPPEQYVLVRRFPDGRPYVTGFDGESNWDVPPTAPVRVSRDPLRFRWPLPGHQHGIPFADLRSDLVQLRDAYQLSSLGLDPNGHRGLLAVKKSPEHRGPKRVELWYDPTSGVIHRMVFTGMPKARGGPDSVAVELVDQRELGDGFFKHTSHHAADRRVIEED